MNRSCACLLLAGSLGLASSPISPAETYQNWVSGYFSAPEITAGHAAPHRDHDGDLCLNLFEYLGGTLPTSPASHFSLNFRYDPFLDEVTVGFPMGADRDDVDYLVLVSNDLASWSSHAVLVTLAPDPIYHLNGYRYVKVGVRPKPGVLLDSDGDGLSDFFENSLVEADPGDAFTDIGDILPGDDFDGDGTLNIDEEANAPATAVFTRPAPLEPGLLTAALDTAVPSSPAALLVHTVLK